jgi:hypothetical protein
VSDYDVTGINNFINSNNASTCVGITHNDENKCDTPPDHEVGEFVISSQASQIPDNRLQHVSMDYAYQYKEVKEKESKTKTIVHIILITSIFVSMSGILFYFYVFTAAIQAKKGSHRVSDDLMWRVFLSFLEEFSILLCSQYIR